MTTSGGYWRCICGVDVPSGCSHSCMLTGVPPAPSRTMPVVFPRNDQLPTQDLVVASLQSALHEAITDRDRAIRLQRAEYRLLQIKDRKLNAALAELAKYRANPLWNVRAGKDLTAEEAAEFYGE